MADRTSLKITDERRRLLDEAAALVEKDEYDDPPTSKVIDAALRHLIDSYANAQDYRADLQSGDTNIQPQEAKKLINTRILTFTYRTQLEGSR